LICDNDGFAIPFADDDQYIECEAVDPEAGESETWPSWTDQERWSTVLPTEPEDELMATFTLLCILVNLIATVVYARRAEAAARQAASVADQLMQGLIDQADHDGIPTRRRHL
jgi:hypothetical protein